MIALVMNPGRPEEQTFPVGPGTVTIGRTKDNAIFCIHKSLSRRHAQVEFDGLKLRITDLQSKNGVFHNGRRVGRCEVGEGDTFRCGDITFLVEGSTTKQMRASLASPDRAAQTLPSPFASDPSVSRRPTAHPQPLVVVEDDQRFKDKLFLLIRASELCVTDMSLDRVLDELVVLAVQVLAVDRIVLLTLDDVTLIMRPRVVKTFSPSTQQQPFSQRVVDWVVDHGSPASFADVSQDRTLPGDAAKDANVRGAMCVPINPGGGTIGVIYADSLSKTECFRLDDLALLRAIANLTAVVIESAALRSGDRGSVPTTASLRGPRP